MNLDKKLSYKFVLSLTQFSNLKVINLDRVLKIASIYYHGESINDENKTAQPQLHDFIIRICKLCQLNLLPGFVSYVIEKHPKSEPALKIIV